MKKTILVLLFSLFISTIYLGFATFKRMHRETELGITPVVVSAQIQISGLIDAIQDNRIKYVEILYIPKSVRHSIACDKNCIDTQYHCKVRLDFCANKKIGSQPGCSPFLRILRTVKISQAKSGRDFYWALKFWGNENNLVFSFYGTKSGDVLVNNLMMVHFSDEFSRWISSQFVSL